MPLVQNPAPDFEATAVVGGDFKNIKLADYRGKWVYLFFYPFDFTFVCPTEIIAFSEANEKFSALNCQVLACSIDSKHVHLRWVEAPRKDGGLGGINFPLIADVKKDIAPKAQLKEYGGYSECIAGLQSGAVDAVTTDDSILAGFAAQENYKGQFKLAGLKLSNENYGIGVKKGNTALLNKINEVLKKAKSDGTYDTIYEKWFGKKPTSK